MGLSVWDPYGLIFRYSALFRSKYLITRDGHRKNCTTIKGSALLYVLTECAKTSWCVYLHTVQ